MHQKKNCMENSMRSQLANAIEFSSPFHKGCGLSRPRLFMPSCPATKSTSEDKCDPTTLTGGRTGARANYRESRGLRIIRQFESNSVFTAN